MAPLMMTRVSKMATHMHKAFEWHHRSTSIMWLRKHEGAETGFQRLAILDQGLIILFYVPRRVLIRLLNGSFCFFFLDLDWHEEIHRVEWVWSISKMENPVYSPDWTGKPNILGHSSSSRLALSKFITWKEFWRCSPKTKKSEGENLMYLRTKTAINLPIPGIWGSSQISADSQIMPT